MINNFRRLIAKVKQDPRKAVKFIVNSLWPLRGTNHYQKYIVLSRARTGSNLLISYLGSHSEIFAKGELFESVCGRSIDRLFQSVYGFQPSFTKASGFKIFYYHPCDKPSPEVWQRLIDDKHIKVIHLKRRNILKTITSQMIAEETDQWLTTKSSDKSNSKVVLDPDRVVFEIHRVLDHYVEFEEKFKNHDVFEIFYENLVSDARGEFARVTDFLRVSRQDPKTILVKQSRGRAMDQIENAESVTSALIDAGLSAYIE
jgi:hypothetical protein